MKHGKWHSLLGLANRAGKIVSGEEPVIRSIQSQKAKLVLVAKDASDNTAKKFSDKCRHYEIPLKIAADRYVLGSAIGKQARVAIAIEDAGFAEKMKTLLD